MRLLVINGPNLNLLGTREPDIYGTKTLHDIEMDVREAHPDVHTDWVQSNHEGELIEAIQKAGPEGYAGIILNGAGLSHTSVVLRDAVAATTVPVVEVHISNIHAREAFRQHSMTAAHAVGVITGLGTRGYHLAVQYFQDAAKDRN